jgi:hypothetical protein
MDVLTIFNIRASPRGRTRNTCRLSLLHMLMCFPFESHTRSTYTMTHSNFSINRINLNHKIGSNNITLLLSVGHKSFMRLHKDALGPQIHRARGISHTPPPLDIEGHGRQAKPRLYRWCGGASPDGGASFLSWQQ